MTQLSFIDKSSNVNAAILGKIAVSSDSVNWDFIDADRVTIGQIFSGSPGLNYLYPTKTQVMLKQNDGPTYTFDIQGVKNQASWQGGTQAKLKKAVEDISSW